jgi:nucleoside-diphosphate-sugar epimerase
MGELAGRPDLIRLGALLDRPGDPPSLIADTTRLGSLGFRPAYTLRQGLAAAL